MMMIQQHLEMQHTHEVEEKCPNWLKPHYIQPLIAKNPLPMTDYRIWLTMKWMTKEVAKFDSISGTTIEETLIDINSVTSTLKMTEEEIISLLSKPFTGLPRSSVDFWREQKKSVVFIFNQLQSNYSKLPTAAKANKLLQDVSSMPSFMCQAENFILKMAKIAASKEAPCPDKVYQNQVNFLANASMIKWLPASYQAFGQVELKKLQSLSSSSPPFNSFMSTLWPVMDSINQLKSSGKTFLHAICDPSSQGEEDDDDDTSVTNDYSDDHPDTDEAFEEGEDLAEENPAQDDTYYYGQEEDDDTSVTNDYSDDHPDTDEAFEEGEDLEEENPAQDDTYYYGQEEEAPAQEYLVADDHGAQDDTYYYGQEEEAPAQEYLVADDHGAQDDTYYYGQEEEAPAQECLVADDHGAQDDYYYGVQEQEEEEDSNAANEEASQDDHYPDTSQALDEEYTEDEEEEQEDPPAAEHEEVFASQDDHYPDTSQALDEEYSEDEEEEQEEHGVFPTAAAEEEEESNEEPLATAAPSLV
jgi:hypothetical protein